MRKRRLRVLLATGVLAVFVALALSACGEARGGGGGQEANKKSESGGSAPTEGQIVFRRWFDPDHTKGSLFAMNPDGSHIRQITHPPKGWFDDNSAWSPDGQRVAFHREKPSDYISRITVLNFQTGDTREVTHCGPDQGWSKEHPRPSSGRYCEGDFEAAFSPDGKSIAFRRVICPCDESSIVQGIWIVGLDGSNPHQVTNVDPKLPEAFVDLGPAFSPDGKMLVIDREQRKKAPKLVKLGDEEPYYHAVFVQSLDSSGKPEDAHRITPWKMNCQNSPKFSPDGKLVLFRCLPEGEGGPSNLYWVHPDGTGLHALTHEEDADKQYLGSSFSPSFSGGEGWITAGRTGGYGEEGNADVFRLLIKDGEVVRSENLTKSAIWDSAPVWGTHPPVG
ncbi:MAG TPA: hypothetical protein VF068_02670 [Rubrobacter sp.]